MEALTPAEIATMRAAVTTHLSEDHHHPQIASLMRKHFRTARYKIREAIPTIEHSMHVAVANIQALCEATHTAETRTRANALCHHLYFLKCDLRAHQALVNVPVQNRSANADQSPEKLAKLRVYHGNQFQGRIRAASDAVALACRESSPRFDNADAFKAALVRFREACTAARAFYMEAPTPEPEHIAEPERNHAEPTPTPAETEDRALARRNHADRQAGLQLSDDDYLEFLHDERQALLNMSDDEYARILASEGPHGVLDNDPYEAQGYDGDDGDA